jgi:hypothetical protein
MASIELKDSSLGLSVGFDFATDLLMLKFSNNIWLSIARVFLYSIDKLILTPIKNIILHVNQFREAIIIEWETSKARIQTGKLIEVTKVYEQKKSEVENLNLSIEAKQKLIARLDRALDLHMDRIIEYCS